MLRVLLMLGCLALAGVLVWTLLQLPADVDLQPDLQGKRTPLPELVQEHLGTSGVSHPVTAVLLNFRAYDTLLEIGVLLLAVLGVLAVRQAAGQAPVTTPRAGAVLGALTRLAVPLMVLVAGYLLWAGAHQPGGAFQAGAVLAGAGVLLRLSGRLPALLPPGVWLRAALLLGFAVFTAVMLGVTLTGRELLAYPPDQAGAWILLIEASLTLSIALILVSLFVGAPSPPEHGDGGEA